MSRPEHPAEHGVDVAESRLSGFQTHHAGDDRTVHLSADAVNQPFAHLFIRSHHDVARRSADDAHQRVRSDGRSYGSHVAVVGSAGHHHVRAQSQSLRPFRTKLAYGLVGSLRLFEQAGAESLQPRVEFHQELFRRQAAPLGVPHGFVSAGTAAAHNVFGMFHARQHGRQPLAVFNDRISLFGHLRVFTQHMDGFGPIPLGGVNAAFVLRVVHVVGLALLIDFRSLFHGRVVFPQDEHGVGIVFKLGAHGQRHAALVGKGGRGAGGVEGNAYDFGRHVGRALRQCFFHGTFQHLQVIFRMLAPLVGTRIAIQALHPARIIFDRRGQYLSRRRADHQSPGRIAAVIQPYDIFVVHDIPVLKS